MDLFARRKGGTKKKTCDRKQRGGGGREGERGKEKGRGKEGRGRGGRGDEGKGRHSSLSQSEPGIGSRERALTIGEYQEDRLRRFSATGGRQEHRRGKKTGGPGVRGGRFRSKRRWSAGTQGGGRTEGSRAWGKDKENSPESFLWEQAWDWAWEGELGAWGRAKLK